MAMNLEKAKTLIDKLENQYGFTRLLATEFITVASVYEAFFEEVVHETDAAASLTQAAISSMIANLK